VVVVATLPTWVKPTSADFDEGTSQATLSSTGLALTGASGTRNIGWAEADVLSGLTTREAKPFPVTADAFTIWDASASKFKTVPWRNYLGSTEIFMKLVLGLPLFRQNELSS
jgi:hypothetical protein